MSRASNQEQTNAQGDVLHEMVNDINSSPTIDLVNHSYENQTPNACNMKLGSKENTADANITQENVDVDAYETCVPALDINKTMTEVDKTTCQQDCNLNEKSTENLDRTSKMQLDGTRNEVNDADVHTCATEMLLLGDEQLLSMPPPSPCKSHAGIDYTNVPKYAKPSNSETKIHETCHGYVNLSDDMKLCTKEISTKQLERQFENKNKIHFLSDQNLSVREPTVYSFDSRYVNSPENLGRPPRYDETSFKLRQVECTETYVRDMKCKPNYVNVPEKNPQLQCRSKLKKEFEKPDGDIRKSEVSETDMYLSMAYPCEQDTYIPVEHPDSLTSYERNTIRNHSVKHCNDDEAQVEDYVFSDGYVDTQQSSRMFSKASSCDNVYSYVDPQLVCNLYRGSDRVTKVPYSKPRPANRSKTFGAADSKDRSYKIVKLQKCSFRKDEMSEMSGRNISKDSNNASIDHKLQTDGVDAGYVNTERALIDISKGQSKVSKIPVSTRRKSSCEIKGQAHTGISKNKTKTSNIPIVTKRKVSGEIYHALNDKDSKIKRQTSDDTEHDYENEMPKRSIKPPGVRKLKAPAVLPKPKLQRKPESQETPNMQY